MADQTPAAPAKAHRPARRLAAAVKRLIVRVYALAILLVVIWTGYTAVVFLVRSVFEPTLVPEQFLTWQTALSGGKLHAPDPAGEIVLPRSPMEHYHRVDRLLPVDPHNGCLTSGCHSSLAHQKRKEVRAFANLHATFLSCMMCHDESITGPTEAMWVDLQTGEPAGAPAALELMGHFELGAAKIQEAPAEFHATVTRLLPGVVSVSRDPALEFLSVQINTSEPGSPVWRHAIAQLAGELPNHVRGEYGTVLAPKTDPAQMRRYHQQLVELAREYRTSPESIPERKRLHGQIHKGVLAKPSACLSCHGGDPPRLNYESLGYSPRRAASLRDSEIARQMQAIQEGQPFYLPRILEGGHAR